MKSRPPDELLAEVTNVANAQYHAIEAIRYHHEQGEVVTHQRAREIAQPFMDRLREIADANPGMFIELNVLTNFMIQLAVRGPTAIPREEPDYV